MEIKEIILIGLAVWNAIVFLVYAYDKSSAARRQWRVPESTLILLAIAGGGLGAFLGMYMIRHKTRHLKFKLLVPLTLVVQLAVFIWAFAR